MAVATVTLPFKALQPGALFTDPGPPVGVYIKLDDGTAFNLLTGQTDSAVVVLKSVTHFASFKLRPATG
jgi:hypothetical protein